MEPLIASNLTGYHPLKDQLVIGEFARTLMRVSAALEKLIATYPDLIQHSKPFGMNIGVEVFALANNPIIDNYPALKDLVLSFKQQFSELGIDPRMVRRANEVLSQNDNDSPSSHPPIELQEWLERWLDNIPRRGHWVLSPHHLQSLLGPDLYPHKNNNDGDGATPTQAHLDMLVSILGPHVLGSMVRAQDAGGKEEYASMSLDTFTDVTRRDWESERGLRMGYRMDMDMDVAVPRVTLEQAFPADPVGQDWAELQLQLLHRYGRAADAKAKEERERMSKERELAREEADPAR